MNKKEAIRLLNLLPMTVLDTDFDNATVQAINMAIEALQERPKGRWELGSELDDVEYEHFLYCSNCHEEAYWDTDYGQQTFDFCPYCGADMRGENYENT